MLLAKQTRPDLDYVERRIEHYLFGMVHYLAVGLPWPVTDDLDDLLNELDEERPKNVPSEQAGKHQSSSTVVQKKEEQGQSSIILRKFLDVFLHCIPQWNLFRILFRSVVLNCF